MRTTHRTLRAGWTLTDLAVVMATGVLLAGLVLPALAGRSREQAGRAKCANSLRQIALAALMYANNEVRTGQFPRTYWDTTGAVTPTEYTAANSPNSFGPGGPSANDVTAALFLLLKPHPAAPGAPANVEPAVFVCPSTRAVPWDFGGPGQSAAGRANFPSRKHLAYSYANPYPHPTAVQQGWKFNNTLGSDYPFAADMNPGGNAPLTTPYDAGKRQMTAANSPNHDGDGQNVAYCDGHVEFQQAPFCGALHILPSGQPLPYRDNIYTAGIGTPTSPGGAAVKGPPTVAGDMVLLPTMADGAQPPATAMGLNSWLLGLGIGLLVLVGASVIIVVLLSRKNVPAPAAGMPPGYPGYPNGVPLPPPHDSQQGPPRS